MACELRSILRHGSHRGTLEAPIEESLHDNPMSILKMTLLSIISTQAHMGLYGVSKN